MPTLIGNELVAVTPITTTGQPASAQELVSANNVAALAKAGSFQIVTNRNIITNASRQGTANSRTDVQLQSRYKRVFGNSPVTNLMMLAPAYVTAPTGEALLGNSYTYEAAIEQLTPTDCFAEFLFYTTNLPTIIDGYPYVMSSCPVGYNFPANANCYLRQGWNVANDTLFIPTSTGGSAVGDAAYLSPSTASQIPGTGALTQPAGGTGYSTGVGVMVGVPKTPIPAIIYIGDSIPTGVGETTNGDVYGNFGFIARGTVLSGGIAMPYLQQSVGSWELSTATLALAPSMRSYWPFVSHIINQLGTNDIANAVSFATMQNLYINLWTSQKQTISNITKQPLKVYQTTIMPRTTSTDSWATAAGQTPVAGFEIGTGVRDKLNAWFLTQVGNGILDGVINTNAWVENQTVPGAWLTNGVANYPTIDGIHPTTAFHILASQPVQQVLQTFTV